MVFGDGGSWGIGRALYILETVLFSVWGLDWGHGLVTVRACNCNLAVV